MDHNILLADIGNTHIHLFDGKKVEHLAHTDAIRQFGQREILYISVNASLEEQIARDTKWRNISSSIELSGAYDTMGVDRRALCLSRPGGLFVDAGSAITVDVMEEGIYRGGFILPGIRAALESYARISPALDCGFDGNISLEDLPHTTKAGVSYGIIASIKAVIEEHRKGRDVYLCGGDGALLGRYIEGAVYDEKLVFEGMLAALKIKDEGWERC